MSRDIFLPVLHVIPSKGAREARLAENHRNEKLRSGLLQGSPYTIFSDTLYPFVYYPGRMLGIPSSRLIS
jgi:hypothetical protein